MRKTRCAKWWVVGLALGFGLAQEALSQTPTPEEDRVQVFYPKGECETGLIEIEVYNRTTRAWQPHAEHPQIEADTCQREDPGVLLQELRVRCADPEHPARASEWRVGAEVFKPLASSQCKPE